MAVTFSNPTKRSLRVSVKRGYGYYPQMASLMMKTMKDHQMLGTLFSDRHVHTHLKDRISSMSLFIPERVPELFMLFTCIVQEGRLCPHWTKVAEMGKY